MARYRQRLPQLSGDVFLTDGGVETDLIFHGGFDLPDFASFVLLQDEAGRQALRRYYRQHAEISRRAGVGFILESATWRASPDWGAGLGYAAEALAAANRDAIELLVELRDEFDEGARPVVISGCVGPRGDAYRPAEQMTAEQAERYHSVQIGILNNTDADLVTAMTMTYPAEAVGIARAATTLGLPVVISFTVETDGVLPDGTTLRDAIAAVDQMVEPAPAYYMINCAHPSHVERALEPGADWVRRIRGLRANASRKSHAELDDSDVLDEGDPQELGLECAGLRAAFPQLTVLGGCCGTDHRHIQEIAKACVSVGSG